jgi:hypothetical protein
MSIGIRKETRFSNADLSDNNFVFFWSFRRFADPEFRFEISYSGNLDN